MTEEVPVRRPTTDGARNMAEPIYLDSTFIKAQRIGLNAAHGRDLQAIGLTKGGWNTIWM